MILNPKLKTFFCHAVILQRKKKNPREVLQTVQYELISAPTTSYTMGPFGSGENI